MGGADPALKVLLIGAGYFARFHADGWLRNPDTQLAGIADAASGKAEAMARDLAGDGNQITTGTDASTLIGEIQPDIIDIAAPPAAHLDLIELAVKARPKAIICQKPFCGTLDQARMAVDLAKGEGQLLAVHENFRFQPWYRALKTEIASGRISDVYQIAFRLRPGDGRGADAYRARQPYFRDMTRFLVHETAIHWVDTFRFLLGEPQSVMADLRRLNRGIAGEDAGFFILRYGDGRRALFDGNRLADHAAENARLTMGECCAEGTGGEIRIDGFGVLRFRAHGQSDWETLFENPPATGFGGDCVFAFQKHVSDHLTAGTPLETRAVDYLTNMEIEEAIYRAAEADMAVSLTP